MSLNLPTGIPFEYQLDENLKPVVSMKFLGDEETVKKAMEAVAAQGKAKWTGDSPIERMYRYIYRHVYFFKIA